MSNTCTEESKQGDKNQEVQRWTEAEVTDSGEEWKSEEEDRGSKEKPKAGFSTQESEIGDRQEQETGKEAGKEKNKTGFSPQESENTPAPAREDEPDLIDSLRPWKRKFILSMRKLPMVTQACLEANCSPKTAYAQRDLDPLFQSLWDESLTYATDRLEGAAWTRAVDGVEKGIYGRDGEVIATEKVYSDKLLETLLKGNLPQKYRENSAPQVTVNVLNWSNGGAELPQPVEDKREVIEMSSEDCELLGDE